MAMIDMKAVPQFRGVRFANRASSVLVIDKRTIFINADSVSLQVIMKLILLVSIALGAGVGSLHALPSSEVALAAFVRVFRVCRPSRASGSIDFLFVAITPSRFGG